MTAHLTKQLGMAPGGEFRTAFREVEIFSFVKIFTKYKLIRLKKCPVVM